MNLIDRFRLAGSALLGRAGSGAVVVPAWEIKHGKDNPDPEGAFLQSYRRVQWVYSCVYAITSFAAMCPLKLYHVSTKRGEIEKEEAALNHPAYRLIQRPNEQTVLYRFIERLIGFMELGQGGFIYKHDGSDDPGTFNGPARALSITRPDKITKIIPDSDGNIAYFEIGRGSEAKRYVYEHFCYIPYFNPYDDYWSQSSIQAIQQSIIADVEAQSYNMNYLKNWAVPATLLVTKLKLTDANEKRLLKTWDKMFRGSGKSGRTGILDQDVEVKRLADSMKDMDFPGLRKMSMEEIFGAFGCYKGQFGLDVANRSVIESHERQFAQKTMVPKLTYIGQCMSSFIFADWNEDLWCEFDFSDVAALQEDAAKKSQRAVALVNAGIWTRNEARARAYGLAELPGGNVLTVPMNTIPLVDAVGNTDAEDDTERKRALADRAKPEYTIEQETRLRMYERRLTSTEKQAQKWLRAMFDEQASHAKNQLRRALTLNPYLPTEYIDKLQVDPRKSTRDLGDIIDDDFLEQSTSQTVKKVMVAAAEQGIIHGKEALEGIEFEFGLENPRLVDWLKQKSMSEVRLVNGTTKAMLRDAQAKAAQLVAEGAPLSEVEHVIDAAFQHRKNNAATIARTEVTQGIQRTQIECWKAAPVECEKEWLCSHHPDSRHDGLCGQTVPLNAKFTDPVSGGSAPHPGGFGDAAQDINCLCDMVAKVKRESLMRYTEQVVDGLAKKLEMQVYPAKGKGSQSWRTSKKLRDLVTSQ